MLGFVWWLIIGMIAGWAAGQLTRVRGFGLPGNLVIGTLGAVLGGFLFDIIGISSHGAVGSLVTATAGAVVFLLVVSWIKNK